MGEGWHNNHYAYQSSVRQGFRWWEIDPTFYILKVLSLFGLVWDLKTPPLEGRRNQHRLPTRHEIVRRARAMFADAPSMEVIISRAYAVILDTIGPRLSAMAAAH